MHVLYHVIVDIQYNPSLDMRTQWSGRRHSAPLPRIGTRPIHGSSSAALAFLRNLERTALRPGFQPSVTESYGLDLKGMSRGVQFQAL